VTAVGAAEALFKDLDIDGSGRITREELQQALRLLGLPASEDVVIDVVEAIDVDHSGDVDQLEFVACK